MLVNNNFLVSFGVNIQSYILYKNSTISLPFKSVVLRVFILSMLITILSIFSLSTYAQGVDLEVKTDSSATLNSVFLNDSINFNDSLNSFDSSKTDTNIISKDAIESKVEYKADDSLRIDMDTEKIFLYGNAQVNYENIQLNADYIEVDMRNNTVLANGVPDSNGIMQGMPVFKEGSQEYQTGKMTYNFKTQKGKIMEVKTQEGDGYIKGNEVKKTEKGEMYIRNGYYTTCSLDPPHFSLATSKLKIIPDDKIVTGPTILKVMEIPTPLGLPFGFFPNKKGRASGILIPTYGDSRRLGFFLRDGGFYWGINDNIDASLTADIYTMGSWGAKGRSRYVKRYKYNGDLDLSYANIKNSYPEFPDYSESNEFFIRWNHSQDPKARPGSRFSANVNAGTSSNFRNNLNSFTSDYLTNTFHSSISYSNSLEGTPFNFSASARHNQNTRTGDFNVSLPELALNMSRQYPFKSFGKIGNEWWRSMYKNLGITYSGAASNQLQTNDSLISMNRLNQLGSDFKNGVKHSIPISTSFKMFKYFNVNPSFNYNESWTFRTIRKDYDNINNEVIRDTVAGFERGASYNFNSALTTKIYGMYQFRKGNVSAIRHIVTPQISFNYQPEIKTGQKSYLNQNMEEVDYSIFEGSIYGTPGKNKQGRIGFNLLNNIEMKVKDKSDTAGTKKITIFENLGFNTSYDLEADSLNWAPLGISGRTRIGELFNIQFSSTLDPYGLDSNGRKVNTTWQDQKGSLFRMTNTNLAFNFSLKGGEGGNTDKKSDFATDAELEEINANPDQFIDFSIPWSLNVSYNIRYSKPGFEENLTQTLNFYGDVNITEKWKVAFNSGWDFERKDFTYTSVSINRDLHCWELAINWVPFGPRQSYMITLNVKSPVLQDLKLNRRRDYYDVIR